jgi:hypothetical protein
VEESNQTGDHKRFGLVREVIVPIGSLIIALAGIMLSSHSLTTQKWLQESQLKYKGYGTLMGELQMAFYTSGDPSQSMGDHINKAWAEYYPLETFINVDDRQDLRTSLVSVVLACEEAQRVHADPSALEEAQSTFDSRHKALGEKLEEYLGLGKR